MANVRYYGNLVGRVGTKEEVYDATSVKDVLKQIRSKYGDEVYKIAKTSHIIINEENAALLKGFGTKVKGDDHIKFMPVCGGG